MRLLESNRVVGMARPVWSNDHERSARRLRAGRGGEANFEPLLRCRGSTRFEEEQVTADHLLGHGGLFKVPVVGQKLLAGALGVPVSVMQTAGEGGPWGMALLAGYRLHRAEGETLEQYLHRRIFAGAVGSTVQPDARDSRGFAAFMKQYIRCLAVERAAIDALP